MSDESAWTLDEASRARSAAASAAMNAKHAEKYPKCAVCGIHTRPDEFGLCSKTKGEHEAWRAGWRADDAADAKAAGKVAFR